MLTHPSYLFLFLVDLHFPPALVYTDKTDLQETANRRLHSQHALTRTHATGRYNVRGVSVRLQSLYRASYLAVFAGDAWTVSYPVPPHTLVPRDPRQELELPRFPTDKQTRGNVHFGYIQGT